MVQLTKLLKEIKNLEVINKKIDSLPQGNLFDDAKNIEGIFPKSKHTWSEAIEAFEAAADTATPMLVDLEDIHITQPNIQSNKVKKLLTNIGQAPAVNAVEFPDGEVAIYDGHHRLVANWASGNNQMKVNLVKV